MKHIFPVILAVLDICAAIVCVYKKDYPRAIYWVSAAVLTTTTIYIK